MNRLVKHTVRWLAICALPLFAATFAHAQATRTWVSGVGDDANPCSRTAPCKTFAGAISKTAAGGEINALDPGGFGAVTITKGITINGEGTMASVLVSGTNGIIVQAGAADIVILRNIEINGISGLGLNGVVFNSGAELHMDKVFIYGFSQQGVQFQPAAASKLLIANSSFRDNDGGGIYSFPGGGGTALVTIGTSFVEGNGRGVRADDATTMLIQNSSISNNRGNGVIAYGVSRGVVVNMESSSASNNAATGLRALGPATIRISNMNVTANATGLETAGGVIISFGNNHVTGNVMDGAPTSMVGPM